MISITASARRDASEFWYPLSLGIVTAVSLVVGLVLWSCFAPIASATIARGTIVVKSSRKAVQHPDGGVIEALYVSDGDEVASGQVLLRLSGSRLAIALRSLEPLLVMNFAQTARLTAEKSGEPSIVFPEMAGSLRTADFPEILSAQRDLFKARREALSQRVAGLLNEAAEARATESGLEEQMGSVEFREQVTARDLNSAISLAQTGAGTRQRVGQISRSVAELAGEISSLRTRAIEARHKAEHAQLAVARARADVREAVETELQSLSRDRLDLVERVQTISDQLQRRELRAPASGHVVNMAVHTVGGVISPGSTVLEIVPSQDKLVIEAQVRPVDVDHLREGLPVEIHLDSLHSKSLPRLTGRVLSVSADRLVDHFRDSPYFLVRIDADEVPSFVRDELKPGMEASVVILTGEHTAIDYLGGPLLRFFSTALREQP